MHRKKILPKLDEFRIASERFQLHQLSIIITARETCMCIAKQQDRNLLFCQDILHIHASFCLLQFLLLRTSPILFFPILFLASFFQLLKTSTPFLLHPPYMSEHKIQLHQVLPEQSQT